MPAFLRYPHANPVELESRNIVALYLHQGNDEADHWAWLYPKQYSPKNQLPPQSFEPSLGWKFLLRSPDLPARCRRIVPLPARCLRLHLPHKGIPELANRRPTE